MDALSRKREEEAKRSQASLPENHAADDYNPRVRPRETHPDAASDPEKRVSRNLNKLNRELVDPPSFDVKETAQAKAEKKTEVKVVSKRKPLPVSLILGVVMITAIFMYMLTLNVQIEETGQSISAMESKIAELKEETNRLEVQLESKYDLDEIERISTEEYGMVSAESLPKTYVSIGNEGDVFETDPDARQSGVDKLVSGFMSFFRDLFRA